MKGIEGKHYANEPGGASEHVRVNDNKNRSEICLCRSIRGEWNVSEQLQRRTNTLWISKIIHTTAYMQTQRLLT